MKQWSNETLKDAWQKKLSLLTWKNNDVLTDELVYNYKINKEGILIQILPVPVAEK